MRGILEKKNTVVIVPFSHWISFINNPHEFLNFRQVLSSLCRDTDCCILRRKDSTPSVYTQGKHFLLRKLRPTKDTVAGPGRKVRKGSNIF